jgi:hypothetical protein
MSYEFNASVKQIKAEERLLGLLLKYPNCAKYCEDFDSSLLTDGFSRKAFDLILSRIKGNLDIELMSLSGSLSDMEIGKLSRIMAQNQNSSNSSKEFLDCLESIKNEQDTKQLSPSQLSDDDFRNLFKKNNT